MLNLAVLRYAPSEQIYDCSTIGRCDSKKAPFKLKQLTKETELKTLIDENNKLNKENKRLLDELETLALSLLVETILTLSVSAVSTALALSLSVTATSTLSIDEIVVEFAMSVVT